jgi:DNA primase small subunit
MMVNFLKSCFKQYYAKEQLLPPERFSRREYGFILFGEKPLMNRHIAFRTLCEYRSYLKDYSPAHAYYSAAFYQFPEAKYMEEKKWLGAELIFDFDSDHIENASELTYEEQLKLVRRECYKLVDRFLLGDFGFDEKEVSIYFSGSRGYHCHVTHQKVLSLSSNERREIVDYILGNGLDERKIFRRRVIARKGKWTKERLEMPKPSEPGWGGRIAQAIIELIEKIKEKDQKDALEYLGSFPGIGDQGAKLFLEALTQERVERIKQGLLDQSPAIRKFFLKEAIRSSSLTSSVCRADEPVTTDIKRLIRLPGSLHGKTGFKVVGVGLDELNGFDPLREALAFGDNLVKLNFVKPLKIRLGEEQFNLQEGVNEVPEYLAVYAVGRGAALPPRLN